MRRIACVIKIITIESVVCRERRLCVRESDIVTRIDIRRLPPRDVRRATPDSVKKRINIMQLNPRSLIFASTRSMSSSFVAILL